MRLPSLPLRLAGVLLLAGCNTISDAGPSGPFTLSLPEAWPGSTVYVTSADFRRNFTSATLRVDTFTIQLSKSALNDSTVSGTLPLSVSGAVTTEVTVDGVRIPTGLIHVAGFADVRTVPGSESAFWGEMYGWVRNGVASVIGGNDATIRLLDLEQGTASVLTQSSAPYDLYPGASPTFRPGVFLRLGSGNTIEEWDFNGAPQLELGEPSADGSFSRVQTRFGPNVWMTGNDDRRWFLTRPGPNAPYVRSAEILGNFLGSSFSPRGDLVAISGFRSSGASPVYTLPNATVAFNVPMTWVFFPTFSPDGNLLATAGYGGSQAQARNRLMVQNANSGAVRADSLLAGEILGITMDPTRPRFYVAVRTATGQLEIEVYSTVTLQPIARLPSPVVGVTVPSESEGVIIVTPLKGLYFYLPKFFGPDPALSRIWHFTLPTTE
ncbi:MAG: WD40 repeat domain-containing protein [Gemmatimonadales bacterium]